MHKTRIIAIHDPAGVCQSITRLRCAKAAERIDVLFGVDTPGGSRNILLDRRPDSATDSMWPSPNYFGHLLLLPAVVYTASSQSPRTGYACEGSTLTIQCAEDMRIRILRANYGRFSKAVCNDGAGVMDDWDVQCMSTRSLRIVSDLYVIITDSESCLL